MTKREKCERTGGDYYIDISVWNREGKPLARLEGPATTPYAKRVGNVLMVGLETRRGFDPNMEKLNRSRRAGKRSDG